MRKGSPMSSPRSAFFSFSRSSSGLLTLTLALLIGACGGEEEAAQCPPGQLLCGDFCVLAQDDSDNCGACGNVCADGERCISGSCEAPDESCAMPGQALCGESCIDTMSDQNNCGGCGRSCGGEAFCEMGVCACAGGQIFCGPADGCVNTGADPMHCGACGNPCQPGQLCTNGVCGSPQGELCDNEDNDLDGNVDEGESGGPLTQQCSNGCGEGTETCSGGVFVNCSVRQAVAEVCDGEDNDCDGTTDEEVATRYYTDRDNDGFGSSDASTSIFACMPPGLGYSEQSGDCDDQAQDSFPGAMERCDGFDNNCDGNIDEGCDCTDGEIRDCGSDVGICRPGTQLCRGGELGACGGGDYVAAEPTDRCDGLDNDCDESIDEENPADLREGAGNQRCAQASTLPPLREGGRAQVNDVSLYQPNGTQDVDWYSILAEESGLGLDDLDCLSGLGQCFFFGFTFGLPPGVEPGSIEACIYPVDNRGNACSAGNAGFCLSGLPAGAYDPENRRYAFAIRWEGNCFLQDTREFRVEVKAPEGGQLNSCEPYQMGFNFQKVPREECED